MAKKKLSRKDIILNYLKSQYYKFGFNGLSCTLITKHVIKKEKAKDNIAKYMSGSVSSKLQELIKAGRIELVPGVTTKRGGKVYRYKFPNL